MKKRKMLRSTTMVISVLVILLLLFCTYILFYKNYSAYNQQKEIMQKDLLVNFQTKVDETLNNSIKCVSTWMLEESFLELSQKEKVDYHDMLTFYKDVVKNNFLYQDIDCVFGVFRPDADIFATNKGILHSYNLEDKYDFVQNSMQYISELPEKEFVNNLYLSENLSKRKRVNIFIRRDIPGKADMHMYGFVSLNLNGILANISRSENNFVFAFKDDKLLFDSSDGISMKKLDMLKEPSDVIFNLSFASGSVKRNTAAVLSLYIVLFLLLSIVGLMGSVYLSKIFHRPIENILKQISDENEDADIYDETDYISKRFIEIRAKNQQLTNVIDNQKQVLKQNFIRDMLYGIADADRIAERMQPYDLDKLCGKIILALIEEPKNVVNSAQLCEYLSESMMNKSESCVTVLMNSNRVVVIVKNAETEAFKAALRHVLLQINEEFDVNYKAAICEGNLKNPAEISEIFSEASTYLENIEIGYDKLIVTKDDVKEYDGFGYYYPLEYEQNIISSISINDSERALQIVQNILNKNLKELNIDNVSLIEFEFALIGTINRVLQMLHVAESEVFGEGSSLYTELNKCRTSDEISKKVIEMFSSVCDFANNVCERNGNSIIDHMEEYIHENYSRKDMSLVLLAEHFNLTTGYISKLFKKFRQINFKNYLVNYRIQKATEILEASPYIRIVDLAKEVGYDNVNSFMRNFKKIKQVSPGEYKKRLF